MEKSNKKAVSNNAVRGRIALCTALVLVAVGALTLTWLELPTPTNWHGAKPYKNLIPISDVHVVDTETGQRLFSYDNDDGPLVESVSKSPDGKITVVFVDRNDAQASEPCKENAPVE